LYWNAKEALLFMNEGSDGVRLTPLRYALEPFLVGLGDVRSPDDKRCLKLFVIRITDKGIQRYDTGLARYEEEPYCDFHHALFEGHIFTGYLAQEDKIWKWSGTEFRRATLGEARGVHAAAVALMNWSHPWEFDNLGGWSMRQLGETRSPTEFTLNGQPVAITFHGATWPPRPLSVEFVRYGQPPDIIWSLDEEPRRVGKAEYEGTFAPR
jgi:hypothetical protein